MDKQKNGEKITDWLYWVKAPATIPEAGIKKGDRLLLNLKLGEIVELQRIY